MAPLTLPSTALWRVAVTQRRLPGSAMSSARDALDAEWSDWFCANASWAQFLPLPNFAAPDQALHWLAGWGVNALLLTGGEDVGSSDVRDALELGLIQHARQQRWPVLGVCRGMQMLHREAGGELIAIEDHVGQPHRLQAPWPDQTVNSWHRWGIRELAEGWQATALSVDGSVEAMRHRDLPWLGLMWHPERPQGAADLTRAWLAQIFTLADSRGP